MSRIKLLQSSEVKTFNAPPSFNPDQRSQFFAADEILAVELDKLRSPYSKVGFLLQWGYFKVSGRFFEITAFAQADIEYLILKGKYSFTPLDFGIHYSKQIAYYHRDQILQISQWNPFDEAVFRHQIERLVERQWMPRKILFEMQSYLFRTRMEAPAYDKYLKIINETMLLVGKRLSESLAQHLSGEHRAVLDEFLIQKTAFSPADLIQTG